MKPNGKFYISQAHICISSLFCLSVYQLFCLCIDFCRLISISQYFF
eukprot:UN02581